MSLPPPRSLVDVDTSTVPQVFTDTLIIGSGVAGLRAALAAAAYGEVLIATKAGIRESNTEYAQGGIAAVLSAADSIDEHVHDTLLAGAGLCDEDVVRSVVGEGPERIREVLSWGARFDQHEGEVLLTREGGHSRSRIAHAGGDATGHEFQSVFISRVREAKIPVWENAFLVDLLTREGSCVGAVIQVGGGERRIVWAGSTILASGGASQVFRESTNPGVATGDGLAAALRAGARLRDLEFVQFHPTVLYIAGAARKLISEAVRGEGGLLLNLSGRRFMPEYHPDAELAPRDVVSRAIVSEMAKNRETHVLLDMRMQGRERIAARFPGISATCRSFGIDPAEMPVPVRPSAHYFIGGLAVDDFGATTVRRLFACGEVTASGLHGANRLGSNSLLEGLVYGARAGERAGRAAAKNRNGSRRVPRIREPGPPPAREPLDVEDMRASLKALIWRSAGILRQATDLSRGVEMLDTWARYVLPRRLYEPSGWELQNMVTIGRLLFLAALRREETRGAHARVDFPDPDPELCGHLNFEIGRPVFFTGRGEASRVRMEAE